MIPTCKKVRHYHSGSSPVPLVGKGPHKKTLLWSVDQTIVVTLSNQVKLALLQKLTKQSKMHRLSPLHHLPTHAGALLLKLDFHWAQRAFTLSAMNVKVFTYIISGSEARSSRGTEKKKIFVSLETLKFTLSQFWPLSKLFHSISRQRQDSVIVPSCPLTCHRRMGSNIPSFLTLGTSEMWGKHDFVALLPQTLHRSHLNLVTS